MATATFTVPELTDVAHAAQAALTTMSREDNHRFYLAWNASQPDPLPVCPRCNLPFDASDRGDLFPKWCSCCEATLIWNNLRRLICRYGRAGTKAKLAALVRMSK
jgi:hypothetical protein